MNRDFGSNYTASQNYAHAAVVPSTVTSSSIDLGSGENCAFLIDVSAVAAGGTLDITLQDSADNSTFANSTVPGNDLTLAQITATGLYEVKVPNPGKRYQRLSMVVGTANVTFGVIGVKLDGYVSEV